MHPFDIHSDLPAPRLGTYARDSAEGLILQVTGELDLSTLPALKERLDDARDRDVDRIVVDLSRVTFIDSIALASLVATRRALGAAGRLAIVTDDEFLLLVLRASGTLAVLDVFADPSSARSFAFA